MKMTKSKSFSTTGIIPYCLIFIILVGLFSPMMARVNAAEDPPGTCRNIPGGRGATRTTTKVECENLPTDTPPGLGGQWTATASADNAFQAEIDEGCEGYLGWSFKGCLLKFFYYTIFQLPSLILWLSAQFFDVMVNLGINSTVTRDSGFIPAAWAVVRDLSNIFFILILLYIAIQTILGLGGSEVKKMIARVIIIALLINFSMFFTKIVIDSSNVLALIFYNRLDVTEGGKKPIPKDAATGDAKNISAAMWKTFDATRLINSDTIELMKSTKFGDKTIKEEGLPFALSMGVMVIAGLIMLFAAYAFFVAGLMFIGRLIELWVLIIFSPFAFMSWTVPKFASIEYLGWDAWFKRLISTAFMAPIFMFFIYLIFMLLPHIYKHDSASKPFFSSGGPTTLLGTILGILIPALIIMYMLLKAVDFAKKGGGKFGEIALTAAKVAGGVALGVATGGAALALRGTVGRVATNLSESNRMRDWAARNKFGSGVTRLTSKVAAGTYDARNAPGVGALAKAGGISLDAGLARKESFGKNRAARVKREEEFTTKQLDTSDYGKAQLTRGGMSARRAADVEAQLIRGGMDRVAAAKHKASLEDVGINVADVSNVSRHLDAARREQYADRLDRRSSPTVFGPFYGHARRTNAAKRISANKIRRSAPDAAKKANMAEAMAAWAAAGGSGTTPTTTPATGGSRASGTSTP